MNLALNSNCKVTIELLQIHPTESTSEAPSWLCVISVLAGESCGSVG